MVKNNSSEFNSFEPISEQEIRDGLQNNIIRLIPCPDDADDTVVKIGDYWFYAFPEMPPEELNTHSTDWIAHQIAEAINDEPIRNENADNSTEFMYYKAILQENKQTTR